MPILMFGGPIPPFMKPMADPTVKPIGNPASLLPGMDSRERDRERKRERERERERGKKDTHQDSFNKRK